MAISWLTRKDARAANALLGRAPCSSAPASPASAAAACGLCTEAGAAVAASGWQSFVMTEILARLAGSRLSEHRLPACYRYRANSVAVAIASATARLAP